MRKWIERIPVLDLTWLLRYWLGIMMIYHSYWAFFDKGGMTGFAGYLDSLGVPFPAAMAIVVKSCEFFGGILLLMSLLTRIVSFLIFSVMSVAVFHAHDGLIWSEGELAFNYWIMALILFFNPRIPFAIIKGRTG